MALCAVVALGGAAVIGFVGVSGRSTGCDEPTTTITVATSAETLPALERLADQWSRGRPAVDGHCVAARAVTGRLDEVAAALGEGSASNRVDDRPDVWIPDSSLWLGVAASEAKAAAVLPTKAESIATSPVVLALRQPIAEALGWPRRTLGWADVIGAFARPDVWAKAGHPEWAKLRVGVTDPSRSTAGLASVLVILDWDATGTVSDDDFLRALGFAQSLGAVAPDTQPFFAAQDSSAPVGPNSVVAAFPALERDLATYRAGNPAAPMVPVYATEHPVVADYPYAVLSGDWVSRTDRSAAELFRQFLLTGPAQDELATAGLRGPNRDTEGRALLASAQGFSPSVAAPRPMPDPATLNRTIGEWASLQRQVNLLAVLDTSGSMRAPVPGTSLTRLGLLRQTAITGFGLLPNAMSVGLWEFSLRSDATSGYRVLVPFGSINGDVDGVPRRQALATAVPRMRAGGETPLYETAYAAFRHMQQRWQPNSTNAVLLITDGINEAKDGLTLDELIDRLRREQRADKPVQIIGIALSTSADANALRRISDTTGGRTFVVRDPAKAVQTLVLAFTGRLQ